MDDKPIKGLTINIKNGSKEDIAIIFAEPYKKDVVGLITDKCVLNLVNCLLDTKIEDKEKEEKEMLGVEGMKMLGVEGMKMVEGEEKNIVEGEGNVNEMLAEKGESVKMLKREDGKDVEWMNESKMKKWEKVWLDAWNLEMERRQTAKIFDDRKSQILKKEIVEDFAADNYEQELDILNSMTEATKDDPDYAIEVKVEPKISPNQKQTKKLHSKSIKTKKSSVIKSVGDRESVIEKTCRVCGKFFNNLTEHIRTEHRGEKPFKCEVCGKGFLQKGSLETHKTKHINGSSEIVKVTCEVCGKLIYDLPKHLRTHTGEKPYSCDICGKGFAQNMQLKNHKMVHNNDRPFSCDICGNGFTRIRDLTDHRKIHTGEKPHSCDVCGRKFIRMGDLNKHKKTHSGVRPFSCETCGSAFYDKNSLNNHIRIHKGERNFACEVCEKKFLYKSGLNEHLRMHTGEKPYSCDSCGRAFAKSHHLKTHKNTCSKANVKKEYPLINHL